MHPASARASLAFSCLGHLYAHLFEPIFFICALVLPAELGMPYEEVLALVIGAKLLYGVLAPAVGWLGDRWSVVGMMAVYFLGLGFSALAVGMAEGPVALAVTLSFLGLFGSIYHPVGIAWLVRNAVNKGSAIGINGVFGGIGPAAAGLAAGGLIAVSGWRAAFIVPGLAVIATGLVFLWMLRRGLVVEAKGDRAPAPATSQRDRMRAGLVLGATMLCAGLVYQATQPALPKLFEERLGDAGVLGASAAVSLVYLVAGLTQIVAGRMADRFSPRLIYVAAAAVQVPLLAAAAWGAGWPLVAVAMLAVTFNMAAIPAENVLLARYAPPRWRGTAFGLKFVLSFGVSGLGVPLVSLVRAETGGFGALFALLAAAALAVAVLGLLLPADPPPEGSAPPA